MTKANFAQQSPRSGSSTNQEGATEVDHGPFQTTLGVEDDNPGIAAPEADNGGGTSGTHGNGSAG